MLKRIFPVAGLLGLLSVVLAGSAAAGGGGGYGGPGLTKFSDTTAIASFGDPYSGTATMVYVDRGQLSFKLKRTPGAPVTEVNGTMLSVNQYTLDSFAYGCWVIPDSAFNAASDLSSATVNVHATPDIVCPGF
jgi:hypothetical protein